MANITGYKFSDKSHSGKGILSTVCGLGSLVIFIALIAYSGKMHGKGSIYIGSIGLVAVVFSAIGLIIGIVSFLEPNKYKLFSRIGVIFNMVVLLIWTSIIMIGA